MNWKLKLFQILRCFEEMEGTWFGGEWFCYGITDEEKKHIEKEYALWHDNLTSSLPAKNPDGSETSSGS